MTLGTIITSGQVRRAGIVHLQRWLPSVLIEVARQDGRDVENAVELPPQLVRSWHGVPNIRQIRDDQLPNISVEVTGIIRVSQDDGDGIVTATFGVDVAAYARGRTIDDTADIVGVYCAALRVVAEQHPDWNELASDTFWRGEEYGLVEGASVQTLGGGAVSLEVSIPGVFDRFAGPLTPPEDPYIPDPDDPEAETITVTVHPAAD